MLIADRSHGNPTARFSLPRHVVRRAFVTETVLMDVTRGHYYRLDRTAAAMLEALLHHTSLGAAARRLAAEGWGPEREVQDDLDAFAAELGSMGLLSRSVA